MLDEGIGDLVEPISNRRWNREEMHRQTSMRVRSFQDLGLKRGDRVLICFGNRLEFFAELLAIWRLGGCALPIDTQLTAFETELLVEAARPKFSIVDDDAPETIGVSLANTIVLHTSDRLDARRRGKTIEYRVNPNEEALILFTSGSTGNPKGVVHTFGSLSARLSGLRSCLDMSFFQRSMCLLPTHFIHGLSGNSLLPWLSGCDLYILPPFHYQSITKLGQFVDEHNITFLSTVPAIWALCFKTADSPKTGSLRRVHVGSAPLSVNMWLDIQKWTGTTNVGNIYGATEIGSWIAGTEGEEITPETGLIGTPWGSRIRIIRSGGVIDGPLDEVECKPGELGMIWASAPSIMKGYLHERKIDRTPVQTGWFKMGDIGMLDDRGRLILRGREGEEINKGGLKVYPDDIDHVFVQHKIVADACAFRVKDELYGENIGIAIVLTDNDTVSLQGLHEWVINRLSPRKQPIFWYVLDKIPRTDRGKINRDRVMRLCESKTHLDLHRILN